MYAEKQKFIVWHASKSHLMYERSIKPAYYQLLMILCGSRSHPDFIISRQIHESYLKINHTRHMRNRWVCLSISCGVECSIEFSTVQFLIRLVIRFVFNMGVAPKINFTVLIARLSLIQFD